MDKDACVICKQSTSYTQLTHINQRFHYIEGSGQLCRDCHHRLYPNDCPCAEPSRIN